MATRRAKYNVYIGAFLALGNYKFHRWKKQGRMQITLKRRLFLVFPIRSLLSFFHPLEGRHSPQQEDTLKDEFSRLFSLGL
ncbi:MAG TPA: hypothetical protein PKI10_15680 [Syntrophorhabdus sp.]|nr:hypothetical protein [Syntrophorhabdus sp.]